MSEGQSELAGVIEGIRAAFAFRRAGLLQTLPRDQVAAVLRALAEEERAARAAARERGQADIRARQRWARAERRLDRPRP